MDEKSGPQSNQEPNHVYYLQTIVVLPDSSAIVSPLMIAKSHREAQELVRELQVVYADLYSYSPYTFAVYCELVDFQTGETKELIL